ncbi:MAG: branched-chain amino acid ABC transporter permease [Armatimonadota bacterium]
MAEFVGQVIFGLAIGAIYSLVAIGFSMIFRATGLLHFAHPDLMMIGAMIGYTVATRTQMPLLAVFVVSGAAVAILSAAIDRVGFRPMRRKGAMENLIIATIGWSIVLVNVAIFVWGVAPLAYPQQYLPKGTRIGGLVIVPQNLLMLAVGVVAMLGLQLFFRTRVGQALRATAENPTAAQLMGIKVERMMSLTFLLSGFLAGGAGVLVASIVYANFDLGLIGIKSFAAAVLGGFGQIGGAMVGGLLLGLIESLGAFYISSAFKDLIAYSLLILVLLIRPTGLFSTGRGRPD